MLYPSNAAFIEENNQMAAAQQQPDDSLLSFDLGDLLEQVSQGERQWSSSSPGVASQPASRGQSSGLTTNDHTNVYIRGLPLHADEALLSVLFCPFGPIESVRIFRSNQNPNKHPFAFVKLASLEQTEAAIAALNGTKLAGCTIEVRQADNDAGTPAEKGLPVSDNIYCKNLPAGFRDNDLRQLFCLFGTVTMCRVLHQGDSLGQGGAALVRFASAVDARRAVMSLKGHRLPGSVHPLIVRFADSAEIKAKKQAKQVISSLTQKANSGMLTNATQQLLNSSEAGGQLMVPSSYSLYTALAEASLSHPGFFPAAPQHHSGPSAIGSVPPGLFSSVNSAHHTMRPESLMQNALDSAELLSSATPNIQGLAEPAPLMGSFNLSPPAALAAPQLAQHAMGAGFPAAMSAPATVYVENLPADTTKLLMYELFAPYGPIISLNQIVDETASGLSFRGLVKYQNLGYAVKAIAALQNMPVGNGSSLQLSLGKQ